MWYFAVGFMIGFFALVIFNIISSSRSQVKKIKDDEIE